MAEHVLNFSGLYIYAWKVENYPKYSKKRPLYENYVKDLRSS